MAWNQGGWGQGSGWNQAAQPTGYRPPPPSYNQRPPAYNAPAAYGSRTPYQAPQGYSGFGQAAPRPPPSGVSEQVWYMFQAVDQDNSGQITALELQQALMNGNWTPFNAETCRLMIGMFDSNKNGTIDVREFEALWQYIQQWRACFERFDTDRSGRISASELSQAFNTFGYRLSPQFSQLCILKFDREKTGEINFDDFIQCCVMLHSLTDAFRRKDTNQSGIIRVSYEEFLEMVLENKLTLV